MKGLKGLCSWQAQRSFFLYINTLSPSSTPHPSFLAIKVHKIMLVNKACLSTALVAVCDHEGLHVWSPRANISFQRTASLILSL